jgi:hypothetical protein
MALWSHPVNAVRPARAAFLHASPQIWKNVDTRARKTNEQGPSSRKVLLPGRSFLDVMQQQKLRMQQRHSESEEAKNFDKDQSEKYEFVAEESEAIPSNQKGVIPRVGPISDIQIPSSQELEEEYIFEGPKRCGTVAIVGAPNAGKSTLMNHMIGSKVAIVTHKRQTTRNSVTGIGMEGGTQIVYLDTPGIMAPRPKERLNKAMVKSAWNSARDADEVLLPLHPLLSPLLSVLSPLLRSRPRPLFITQLFPPRSSSWWTPTRSSPAAASASAGRRRRSSTP